ncbi:E3 ubiquitin-protein ligase RNF6 isoform X2 [Dioscorea cayenensis subsp. rotundata]|uniref:E3 ubiquitin-protein ligase RNF6 isoform X2 n=1 Tax=Dioscorea cayennensis subsp. rotundata TaxID=55577 RepID=A0AB40CUB7_DIOCR|nr:E3 ubiquitin-protein ligase RNF6 isoform X2 [Dioscorea cayenensis subsp. rotundata]
MGSSSSKDVAAGGAHSSSSGGGGREPRSKGVRVVFGSSCFGTPSTLHDDQEDLSSAICVSCFQIEEEDVRSKGTACTEVVATKSNPEGSNGCIAFRVPRANKISTENDGGSQEGIVETDSGASGSSTNEGSLCQSSSNNSSHSRTPFGFRLSRTASLGSSQAHSAVSASLSFSNTDRGVDRAHMDLDGSEENSDETPGNVVFENVVHSLDSNNTSLESRSAFSDRDQVEAVNIRIGRSSRRSGPQEPFEGSVRFSRTLSVGRLRDRVLRRTSNSEGLFGSMPLEDRSSGHSGRRVTGGRTRSPSSSGRSDLPTLSSNHSYTIGSSVDHVRDYDSENPQMREASNRDWLEHRSAFLERRRRIRSQVRALQRMGSRFENFPGHDRSCILSGQHRTGRCTCRTSNHAANPDDDTRTRASISRIVMLAEALFEVLDEIHQQSVALSSRPSVSSVGSIPAPKDVVECMPVRIYTRPHKYTNEDAAQCYICLMEYEEGDCMRILPCQHEFHQTCIDKWLKEIHRVCPLCRGDVCRSEVSSVGKTC